MPAQKKQDFKFAKDHRHGGLDFAAGETWLSRAERALTDKEAGRLEALKVGSRQTAK